MVLKWLKKKLAQSKIELNLPNDIESCHELISNFILIVEQMSKRIDEQS